MSRFLQSLFGLPILPPASFFARPPKSGATSRLLHLVFPAGAPYADDNDLASFVGIYVRPLVPYLDLFWFTRYGAAGAREVKFRFTTTRYSKIRAQVDLLEAWQHGRDGCVNYNHIGDFGADRCVPGNRAAHANERALGVYQFLTSGARLYVDSLVPNGVGWKLEDETASTYNRETTMETFHHFFCNMTTVPTWASIVEFPNQQNQRVLVSDISSRTIRTADPTAVEISLARIYH